MSKNVVKAGQVKTRSWSIDFTKAHEVVLLDVEVASGKFARESENEGKKFIQVKATQKLLNDIHDAAVDGFGKAKAKILDLKVWETSQTKEARMSWNVERGGKMIPVANRNLEGDLVITDASSLNGGDVVTVHGRLIPLKINGVEALRFYADGIVVEEKRENEGDVLIHKWQSEWLKKGNLDALRTGKTRMGGATATIKRRKAANG